MLKNLLCIYSEKLIDEKEHCILSNSGISFSPCWQIVPWITVSLTNDQRNKIIYCGHLNFENKNLKKDNRWWISYYT